MTGLAASYRSLIANCPVVVSFVTVTELRYGALKAGWGDLRRRGLERDLARLVTVQPDDELMQVCAEPPKPGGEQPEIAGGVPSSLRTDQFAPVS